MTSMVSAFDILQDRIMRSRLAGDPPDALVQVRVGKVGMFEFHRADELIALAVRRSARRPPKSESTLNLPRSTPPGLSPRRAAG